MAKRYVELDSLRGLAALTVVFHHALLIFPTIWGAVLNALPWWLKLLVFSPLRVVWAGHEAVVFFFLLSAFVLMLPFCSAEAQLPYRLFLTKRILRLYPPYLAAVLVAFAARTALYHGPVAGVSEWFNLSWQYPVDGHEALNHLLMIGCFNNGAFDPVLWSLVQEMRISLLFPLIALLVWRWEKAAIALAVVLVPVKGLMIYLKAKGVIAWEHDYFQTMAYVTLFIVGALLAKHRNVLAERFLRLNTGSKILLVLAALLAYTNAYWLTYYPPVKGLPFAGVLRRETVFELITALGVSILIIASLAGRSLSAFLTLGPIQFLGRISYSLYLFHAICLKVGVTLLYPHLPLWLVLLLCLPVSFLVATLSYRWVEVPTMNLGKRLTKHYLETHPKPAVASAAAVSVRD